MKNISKNKKILASLALLSLLILEKGGYYGKV